MTYQRVYALYTAFVSAIYDAECSLYHPYLHVHLPHQTHQNCQNANRKGQLANL